MKAHLIDTHLLVLRSRSSASVVVSVVVRSLERVSTLGFLTGPHIRREYSCSSQEAELREISRSSKNLFLNRCKINMFKLRSSAKVKVKYQGHVSQKMGVSGALVFHKHILFSKSFSY